MKHQINQLTTVDKKTIINSAKDILKQKYPDLHFNACDFDISAWNNDAELITIFKRNIRFVPLHALESDFQYNLTVNVTTQEIYPLDIWGITRFYMPTEAEAKKIGFISHKFNLPFSGFDNTLVEKEDCYEVYINNDMAYSIYYLDKTTGKEIKESLMGSYYQDPKHVLVEEIDEEALLKITS